MRKLLFLFIVMMFGATYLMAEPYVLEQAGNVLEAKTLETGLADCSYAIGSVTTNDNAGKPMTRTNAATIVLPFYARYAFNPVIETELSIPYVSESFKSEYIVNQVSGPREWINSKSEFDDPTIIGKYSFKLNGLDFAAGVAGTIPKITNTYESGLDVKPLVALRKIYGKTTLNVNVSYKFAGEFSDMKPGNTLSAGAGAEISTPNINWIAEFIYYGYSKSTMSGANETIKGPSTAMNLIFGVRHNMGNIKTKFGVQIALGDLTYRLDDYRILGAVTYLWKL